MTYKPDRTAFLYYWCIKVLAFVVGAGLIISTFLYIYTSPIYIYTTWIVAFLIFIVSCLHRYVRFDKEEYVIKDDRVVKYTGGLFSDKKVELLIRKITKVKRTLPFFEHWIFSTGHVRVESAGSGGTEVHMVSLSNTFEVYDEIESGMKGNGFVLDKERVVQQEVPSKIGSFIEVSSFAVSSILVFVFGVFPFLESVLREVSTMYAGSYIVISILTLVVAFFLSRFIIRFVDLIMRTYTMYDDCIVYEEGFLTKVESLIPIENLADSEIKQSFLYRLFGIYDIVVSCQGSASEITFRSMYNGARFEDNLDTLIEKTDSLVFDKDVHPDTDSGLAVKERSRTKSVFTKDLGIQFSRHTFLSYVLLPFSIIFFPLFPLWLIYFLYKCVEVGATSYSINDDSVESRYKFLRSRTLEFSNDKITGVVVRENFIDRLFGTVSLTFWSIGSSQDIVFKNVPRDDWVSKYLESEGYLDEDVHKQFDPSFTLASFIFGNPKWTFLFVTGFLLGGIGSIYISWLLYVPRAISLLAGILYVWGVKYFEKARFELYDSFLHYKEGFLFKTSYYVDYDDVKDVESLKYLHLVKGTVSIGVAGESSVDQQGQAFIPYGFSVRYVDDIFETHEEINSLLSKYEGREKVLTVSEPNPINSLFKTSIAVTGLLIIGVLLSIWFDVTSMIVFAFLISLVIVGYVYVRVKVVDFEVNTKGLKRYRGILYRDRKTVLFEKVDHLNKDVGWVNKLFGNGSCLIYNTGSSGVEMTFYDLSDYEDVFEIIQKHYL